MFDALALACHNKHVSYRSGPKYCGGHQHKSDTLDLTNEHVEQKDGIPPVQQRLIYSRKQLADDKLAKDYDIEGASILNLVLALCGGFGVL
ncbi:hypothetical protein Bca4012_025682 [Brassica carinata]|uniref:Ubiquitin-like domain-containing protein n=1 Tax=Brassica carinata TaxID=52824 RepID=A0A8X8ART1_BRACI|nr:hypothetical protein Bca52824_022786 [Brassica carinata]